MTSVIAGNIITYNFDKIFDPILVTGDDGNEYNVIPSDRFK